MKEELLTKKQNLKDEALKIINNCRAEIRMFNDDEQNVYNTIVDQIKNINEELNNIEDNNKNIKKTMEKRFSLVSAINKIANNRNLDSLEQAVMNVGANECRNASLPMGGQIQLPTEELRAVTLTNDGDDLVATELFDLLGPLRTKNVMFQSGAKFLTGLKSKIQIPIMGVNTCTWEGEVATASASTPTFSSVTLEPKRLSTYVDISKTMLQCDSIGVENMIRQDLVAAINSKIEETILGSGAGSATQPEGIFHAVTANTTGATTMEKIAEVESKLEDANVYGEYKYIAAPSVKAKWRSLAKGGNIAQSLYANGEVDGTPVLTTGHVAKDKFIVGDWSNLVIAQFGGIDIVVDNYTQAVNNMVRIVVNFYVDAKVLRPEAFQKGSI
ncbi:MAG: phage major capsid protein [Clostridia bacterium]|nr:phage major capsid protein [Clostridia bacterium]